MSTRIHLAAVLFFVLVLGLFFGCSQDNQLVNSLSDRTTIAYDAIENELSMMSDNGLNVGASKGIFSLEWGKLKGPMNQQDALVGRAMAIGFNSGQPQGPPHSRRGIDMGSVYLNYANSHLALQKRTGPHGGVSYASFSGPRDGGSNTNIEFVAGGSYEFEVTGSDGFSAIRTTLTAPSALLKITSPAANQAVNPSNDLTITWEGGVAEGKVLLSIMATPPRPNGMSGPGDPNREGGMGPGGHHGGGRGPGNPPNPMDPARAIIIKLDNNPGTYTIVASKLQELIQRTNAAKLMVGVGQLNVTEVEHDGGTIHIALRNGDRLPVSVQ
jgi:hypothetical protein